MPVLALKSGRIWPKRPESCVEVVEATTIDLSSARAGPPSRMAATAMRQRRLSMSVPRGWRSDEQVAGDECPRLRGLPAGAQSGRLARPRGGPQGIADVAGGAAPQHRRALEHDGAPPRRADALAAPGDASARRGEETHGEPQQGRLARPVRPDEHGRRAGRQPEGDAIE